MELAYRKGDLERVNELAMQIFVDGTGRAPDQVNPALRKKVYDTNLIALRNETLPGKDVPPPNASENYTCPC